MKKVYDASNSTEAYMVANLLEQHNINARVDGEYLQGGIGELQALDIVRVMVSEQDYNEAKSIIEKFESNQPRLEKNIVKNKINPFIIFILSLLIGVGATAFYYNVPIQKDHVDLNGDGLIDVTYTYHHNRLTKESIDYNYDGKVDTINKYNMDGYIKLSESDYNFDGIFETTSHYDNTQFHTISKSDTNNDGTIDYITQAKHQILNSITFISPETQKPIKIQHFDSFKMIYIEADTNNDGLLDTIYELDELENIINTRKIK